MERLDTGLLRIGVHIADVSHFVIPGTALDEEAERRGTSVYLVEKVVPMLPPLLCEQLCRWGLCRRAVRGCAVTMHV